MGKGDNFERDQCRFLSLWWTQGKRDDVFWRNRTRVTSKTPHAERQLGDLISTHPMSIPMIRMFNVEFKTGYSKTKKGTRVKNIPWDVLDLIDSTKPKGHKIFDEFWEQTITDAKISGRIPLLIFKRDFHVPVVATLHSDVRKLEDYNGFSELRQILIAKEDCDGDFIRLFRRDDFFNWLNPETIKVLSAQKRPKLLRRKDATRTRNNPRRKVTFREKRQ